MCGENNTTVSNTFCVGFIATSTNWKDLDFFLEKLRRLGNLGRLAGVEQHDREKRQVLLRQASFFSVYQEHGLQHSASVVQYVLDTFNPQQRSGKENLHSSKVDEEILSFCGKGTKDTALHKMFPDTH